MTFELRFPFRLAVNANGSHRHWRVVAAARQKERATIHAMMLFRFPPKERAALKAAPFFRVTLIRHGFRKMDFGNLVYAFKGVQDTIAAFLGVDDGDETRVEWQYKQSAALKGTPSRAHQWEISIAIEATERGESGEVTGAVHE